MSSTEFYQQTPSDRFYWAAMHLLQHLKPVSETPGARKEGIAIVGSTVARYLGGIAYDAAAEAKREGDRMLGAGEYGTVETDLYEIVRLAVEVLMGADDDMELDVVQSLCALLESTLDRVVDEGVSEAEEPSATVDAEEAETVPMGNTDGRRTYALQADIPEIGGRKGEHVVHRPGARQPVVLVRSIPVRFAEPPDPRLSLSSWSGDQSAFGTHIVPNNDPPVIAKTVPKASGPAEEVAHG